MANYNLSQLGNGLTALILLYHLNTYRHQTCITNFIDKIIGKYGAD